MKSLDMPFMLKSAAGLALLAELALFLVLFNTRMASYQQQFLLWRLVPMAASVASVVCLGLLVKTHRARWVFVALAAWVPSFVIFMVSGMVSH